MLSSAAVSAPARPPPARARALALALRSVALGPPALVPAAHAARARDGAAPEVANAKVLTLHRTDNTIIWKLISNKSKTKTRVL